MNEISHSLKRMCNIIKLKKKGKTKRSLQKSYFVLPLIKMRHSISEMSEEELKKFQDSSIRRFLDPLK